MRIDNLIKVIDGKLLNLPSVSFIDQIRIDAKKVKRADAFLCLNQDDLQDAINNGAYAIIFSKNFDIIDKEIAWIKVANIEKTIIRYLRYKTVQVSLKIFYCHDIVFQILKQLINDKNVIFLDKSLFDNFSKMINAESSSIFISNNKDFTSSINPDITSIGESSKNYINLVKYSLFESDFVINDIYYKNIKIPKIFLHFLNNAINFLQINNIAYSITNIYLQEHFEPVFIDKNLNIKDFGSTNKVLLIEKDLTLISKEIIYLNTYARYAKSCLMLPKNNIFTDNIFKIINYDNMNDIFKIKNHNYNFYLILKKEKDDIFAYITKKQKQKTLFQN